MPSMTPCDPGDVVLVRFPFTDLSSAKKRPAVIVSPAGFPATHGDVVVIALTSREQTETDLALTAWQAAGLPKPTWLKPLVATLASSVVARRLGGLAAADRPRLSRVLEMLLDTSLWRPGS